MINRDHHNNEGDPMSDLKYNLDASVSPRPPWLEAREEVAILERVEDQLLDAFRVHHGKATSDDASIASTSWATALQDFFTNGWTWAGATALAGAAALLLVLRPGAPTMPPLQVEGFTKAPAVSGSNGAATNTVQMAVAPGKQGKVAETNRWDMQVGATTTLAVAREGNDRRTVELKRGFVKVHVVPGQVKQFSVRASGYQVLVKGTVFTVEREGNWLRVEVTRGKVALRSPKDQSELPIAKGQGVRVDLSKGTFSRYQLPTAVQGTTQTRSRLKWMFKQSKEDAFQYGLDLATSRRHTPKARIKHLVWLYNHLEEKRSYKRAIALGMEAARLHTNASQAESMLFDALKLCLDKQLVAGVCQKPLSAYLRRFPTKGNKNYKDLRRSLLQRAKKRGLSTKKP